MEEKVFVRGKEKGRGAAEVRGKNGNESAHA